MNRKAKRLTQLGMCALIFVSMSCHSNEPPKAEDVKDTNNESQAPSEIDPHVRPPEISMDQQIKGAVTDLATRTGVTEDAIKIREARAVQWGSGALGCPKPGMNYTQAIVPGVLLLLEVNGTVYHYHGSTGRSLFYCPAERVQAPAYGQGVEVM